MMVGFSKRWRLYGALFGVALSGCNDFWFKVEQTPLPEYRTLEETFTQSPVPARDILWVLDNTTSMEEEALAIAPHFSAFIEQLGDISYQVGIVTTDVETDEGELQGLPWIITRDTPAGADVFHDNVDAIIQNSTSKAREEGLEAILLALSGELLSAGRPNYGFLREAAGLSVIVVSDEDDESSTADEPPYALTGLEVFVDALVTLKGGDTPDRIIFSAIIGPPPEGCIGSDGIRAEPAERYVEMTSRLNGSYASLCSTDFSEVLATLGEHQVQPQIRFPLQFVPVENSVKVWVDDVLVGAEAWTWDAETNAVVFQDGHIPEFGAAIRVDYQYNPKA